MAKKFEGIVCFGIDDLSLATRIFIQNRVEHINDKSTKGDVLFFTNFEGNENAICGEKKSINELLDVLRKSSNELSNALDSERRIFNR